MRRTAIACLLAVAVIGPVVASGVRVWGYDADELARMLAEGDHDAMRHVDFSRHRLSEIVRLGNDAPYALGLIYRDLGDLEVAEGLLRLALHEAPEPWRELAFDELATLLHDEGRYADLERLARGESRLAARIALAEALYEQERYDDLLGELVSLGPQIEAAYPGNDQRSLEAALWRAVALEELDHPDAADAMIELYRDYPAAPVHSRVWIYLIAEPGRLAPFSQGQTDLFRAKQLQSEGRATEAIALYLDLVGTDPELVGTPWTLLDVYRSGAASGRLSATARALEAFAGGATEEIARRATEYAGRLFRLAGGYAEATRLLGRSLNLATDADDRQRIQWYIVSSRVRSDPVATARELPAIVPTLGEPGYFSDVFLELAGLLAERLAWRELQLAYEALAGYAEPAALARYELALARALERGLLAQPPARAEELRAELLGRAAAQRANRFAALVANALLGRDGTDALEIADWATPEDGDDRERVGSPASMLARTYLDFGLLDRLLATVREHAHELDPELLAAAARRLSADGRIRESILAMGGLESAGGRLTRSAAELRYPLGYSAIIEPRVRDEGIDGPIFYALIREESLFDPEISSFAGAIGLAQLLPSTARDIAGRMRLDDPVLTDPATNLAIGARYFSLLTAQFGTVSRAVAAYNGGQGNVRSWERESPALDEILFHQRIPFAETYNHVRKVVVSAAYYGYLYADRSPGDTVRIVFNLD